MKIIEVINKVDELKPNTYTQEQKVGWLAVLDGKIKRSIIDTHEGGDNRPFLGYVPERDMERELLVPAPYDEMYTHWLEANIDEYNGEIDRYNASITLFNVEYEAFEYDYNRNHMPKSSGQRFLW